MSQMNLPSLPRTLRTRLALTLLAGFAAPATLIAQAPAAPATPAAAAPNASSLVGTPDPAASPVGRWAAERTSAQGIGGWWDIRADGTLTLYIGAMVNSPVKHTADTITLPTPPTGGAAPQIKYKVDGTTLTLTPPAGDALTYHRLGDAPAAADPLLGKWRPDPVKKPSSDPRRAAAEKANANATYVFGADNTETVRIPYDTKEGTWDATTHTYKLPDATAPLKYYVNTAGKLVMTIPPDGKSVNIFIKDPVF